MKLTTLFATFLSLAAMPLVHAGYTFSPQEQSTPSANLVYTSTTGTFQYTDTSSTSDDNSFITLTGTYAKYVTLTTAWSATVNVNLAARSMGRTKGTPDVGMALGVLFNSGTSSYLAGIVLNQVNNTGSTDNTDYPANFYGTATEFEAVNTVTGAHLASKALGASLTYENYPYQSLSGGTSATPGTKSINAATGVLSVSYNPTTRTLTGSYNGNLVGSYKFSTSVTALTLGLYGFSGEGVVVSAGTATETNFSVTKAATLPQTITFPAITAKTLGGSAFNLAATASSGLPVSYAITTNPVTVSGSTVTLGTTVTIQATQAGNATYDAATPVSQTFTAK